MFFLQWPASLWFLRGGGPIGSSVDVCVSTTYRITVSIGAVDSVDIAVSVPYQLSAPLNLADGESGLARSVQANIDLDDSGYAAVNLRTSITPVFVIDQSGQTEKAASSDYKVSASITASIGIDVVPSASYKISASLSVGLLIADNICVSVSYLLSAAVNAALLVSQGLVSVTPTLTYGLSTSINPVVTVIQGGGLVWSKKLGQYVPMRVGS